jgi:hypothetical protein
MKQHDIRGQLKIFNDIFSHKFEIMLGMAEIGQPDYK